ncbi:unnamed protein product [Prorocentrum cordatum]|uniref:Clathrin adaptor alpha/beta/gamma-adaptin appendage Ig-like subdomain domain-containing protein n=1 Tax=Prorocentrum cordatum TaxID=2364126 RepID=A0ABN9X1L5_9DINO|nr:unnamed protein product [Polarella glacialis]
MGALAVDFEVLPGDDPRKDPSPLQVLEELRQQLQDPTSSLRCGEFGDVEAYLALPGEPDPYGAPTSESEAVYAPAAGWAIGDTGRSRDTGHGSLGFPDAGGGVDLGHHPRGGLAGTAWKAEVPDEISHRVQRIERELARTAAGGRDPGYVGPGQHEAQDASELRELEEKYARLQQRLATAEDLIRKGLSASRGAVRETEATEFALQERGEQLAFAKDQWVRETIRASKLADTITALEEKLADRERTLREVTERYSTTTLEVKHLQQLVTGDAAGPGLDPRGLDPHYVQRPQPQPQQPNARTSPALPSSPPRASWPSGRSDTLPDTNSEKYRSLCLVNDAVLYEDRLLQIGVKAEYSGSEGRLAVYFANKGATALQAFGVQYIVNDPNSLRLDAAPVSQQLNAGQQVVQMVSVVCLGPFCEPPWLRLRYILADASPWRGQMRFPIVLPKFMTGLELTPSQFFADWRRQDFALSESTGLVVLSGRLQGSPLQIARLPGGRGRARCGAMGAAHVAMGFHDPARIGDGWAPHRPWAAKFEAQAKQIAALTSKIERMTTGGPGAAPPAGTGSSRGPKSDPNPKEDEADKLRERIEVLSQTIQNLDSEKDQKLKPHITQHTNAGHVLAELERKRAVAVQKKKKQEEAKAAAIQEIGKQDEAIIKLDAEIVQAKRALASTIPDDVFFDCDEAGFGVDQEVKYMLASRAWKRYQDKEPDDHDVDALWQASKGEKWNLLEHLRTMGYKRPKRG